MAARKQDALGIYISVPFCRSKCTYCNFASGVFPASAHNAYVERLIQDLTQAHTMAAGIDALLPRRVDTIYLGGGTPSLLSADLLERLFRAIHDSFDLEPGAEITMECAPGQIADEVLDSATKIGANRVSLGVQSFIDREAQLSGRLHSRAIVERDLERLRAAGITNINIDLIAGLAGQTVASWRSSLDTLIAADVPHASVYMLEVDEDSRLGREMLSHGLRYHADIVPNDDTITRMYTEALDRLADAGLKQYEISNFAREGFESKHNMRYWLRRPYLGVGLDASSMLRAEGSDLVVRMTTTSELQNFLEGSQNTAETEFVPRSQQFEEAWFLGLRLNRGVEIATLESEFGSELIVSALPRIESLAERGLLHWNGKRASLTRQGQLLSNEVFQEFLEIETPELEAAKY